MRQVDAADVQGMYRIVYLSDAVRPVTEQDVQEILEPTRTANAEIGVTGLLVHADQRFLQVLEGTEAAVEVAYERAARSRRHTKLRRTPVYEGGARNFPDWSMGFERAAPRAVVEQLLEPLVRAGHITDADVRGILLARFAALSAARG